MLFRMILLFMMFLVFFLLMLSLLSLIWQLLVLSQHWESTSLSLFLFS